MVAQGGNGKVAEQRGFFPVRHRSILSLRMDILLSGNNLHPLSFYISVIRQIMLIFFVLVNGYDRW